MHVPDLSYLRFRLVLLFTCIYSLVQNNLLSWLIISVSVHAMRKQISMKPHSLKSQGRRLILHVTYSSFLTMQISKFLTGLSTFHSMGGINCVTPASKMRILLQQRNDLKHMYQLQWSANLLKFKSNRTRNQPRAHRHWFKMSLHYRYTFLKSFQNQFT